MDKALPALTWITEILSRHNVPFQISGGLAAKLYGSPRDLNDIDIDIPEESFKVISADIEPYMVFGPAQYKDGKWDLYLMTLNYHGQEIDVGGAMQGKVSSKDRTEWFLLRTDFSQVRHIAFKNLVLPVVSPENLIAYKSHLDGDHQQVDIRAATSYLAEHD